MLVISIPDWSTTPFVADRGADQRSQFAQSIETFNTAARAEVGSQGAVWVDVTDLSRSKAGSKDAVSWEAADGLHPSSAQVMCGCVLHLIRDVFSFVWFVDLDTCGDLVSCDSPARQCNCDSFTQHSAWADIIAAAATRALQN